MASIGVRRRKLDDASDNLSVSVSAIVGAGIAVHRNIL
jgi:hypothetical protein